MSRSIAGVPFEPPVATALRRGSVGSLLVASLAVTGSPGPATISLAAAVR